MTLPQSMRYIEADGEGGPDVLRLATGPLPKPRRNEILIRVLAAGLNRPDLLQRQGLYPPPPGASPVLGLEVSGEVAALGEDITEYKTGDRVCGLANGGGYAEYCAVPALQCLPWPDGYDALRAAALPETYFTVWANLFDLGRLAPGESVLVHGGSSGIGVTAIQLAKEFGSRVYITAGSQKKCDACLTLGADAAINYREADFEKSLRKITGGKGVNVVLDMVGAPYTMRNIRSLAMDGRLVQIAVMNGSKVEDFDLMPLLMHRLVITGSTMRPRTSEEKGAIAQALRKKVWPLLDAGRCGPVIDQVFPLADAPSAHRLMESSSHIGKIMLRVAE